MIYVTSRHNMMRAYTKAAWKLALKLMRYRTMIFCFPPMFQNIPQIQTNVEGNISKLVWHSTFHILIPKAGKYMWNCIYNIGYLNMKYVLSKSSGKCELLFNHESTHYKIMWSLSAMFCFLLEKIRREKNGRNLKEWVCEWQLHEE
jgi:hypothetical protein